MNLLLRAEVRRASGNTRQATATVREGEIVPTEILPLPNYVCIAVEEVGFSVLHFDKEGQSFADTWHESLEAAKKQANFEFGISKADWRAV